MLPSVKSANQQGPYIVQEQHVERQAECDDEDGEDGKGLQKGVQDFQKHHHINPEEIESEMERETQ